MWPPGVFGSFLSLPPLLALLPPRWTVTSPFWEGLDLCLWLLNDNIIVIVIITVVVIGVKG